MDLPRPPLPSLPMPPLAEETDQDLLETDLYEPTGPIDPFASGFELPDDASMFRESFAANELRPLQRNEDIGSWLLPTLLIVGSLTLLAGAGIVAALVLSTL